MVGKGFNAITGVADAMDDNGHGTHCSGTIGASGNNGQGIVGVIWNVSLIGCKFLDAKGSGYTSDAIKCLAYCRNAKARITSNSWGGGPFSQALYDEIVSEKNAGNLFVTAAGNSNLNIDTNAVYPANYDVDNIIVVGASSTSDSRSSYSNYGTINVDLSAPGDNIYSTIPNASFAFYSGTSMATPHVAGTAALLWDAANTSSYIQIKAMILDSVDKVNSLSGYSKTGGRLNVERALSLATSPLPSPSPPPKQKCCKFSIKRCVKYCT
jgi:subtilisin family serine protease